MCFQKCVDLGLGYGESECEAIFCPTPRNIELPPSDQKTPGPSRCPFRARSPGQNSDSNSSQKFGSVGQIWDPRAYIPTEKRAHRFQNGVFSNHVRFHANKTNVQTLNNSTACIKDVIAPNTGLTNTRFLARPSPDKNMYRESCERRRRDRRNFEADLNRTMLFLRRNQENYNLTRRACTHEWIVAAPPTPKLYKKI